ncbi:solute carrier-like protein [Leptotrombidium deliense]|uniref:Solute carrier-like protein n=1 Tax=Leptotrombidium deliense TaxID=299467 RepID=A0A443SBP7_9ACAR|nr:solute carrier-like protein [Leptotrombidium deliense]
MKLFENIAAYQPVINGVGGNLVAIQASRLSTFLHQHTHSGELPDDDPKVCASPCSAFFTFKPHAKVAQILFLMALPSHLLYLFVITLIQGSQTTAYFVIMYISVALLQLLILLYFTRILVFCLWKLKMDPDDSSIPILTAIGDVLGVALLTIAFYLLKHRFQS